MLESEMAVLTSQLHGIMDCSDFISLCHALKLNRLERVHKSRLNKLLCIYHKTNNHLIDKHQEIAYVPINFEKIITGNLAINDNLYWTDKILTSWMTWSENAMNLYWKLSVEDEENKKWWKYLYNLHKMDLKESEFFHKKLVPEGYKYAEPIRIKKLQDKIVQKQVSEEKPKLV